MIIKETTPEEYNKILEKYPHIYNRVDFSELNATKVEWLHYLLFEDSKVRFGLILGEKTDALLAPFSAPFGGFSFSKSQRLLCIEEAVDTLKDYGSAHQKKIMLTLPPLIYDESQLTKQINVLSRKATVRFVDINYHFNMDTFHDYESVIERNAKKNLHRSLTESLEFTLLDSKNASEVSRAYDVIKKNREEHGYVLKMTLEDVLKTIKIIPADFFVVSHQGIDVAAAQIFYVSEGICQVIYWGDLKAYAELRTMNYLAYHVFEYYYNKGIRILDIGPSTEQGIPMYGLCDFKESIGCSTSPKYSFEL